MTGLYRSDFGVYTFLVGACGIVLAGERKLEMDLRRLGAFAVATLAFASPWLLFLLLRGQLGAFFYESSVGALANARGMALPIPMPEFSGSLTGPANLKAYSFWLWYSVPVVAAAILGVRWHRLNPTYRLKSLVTILLSVFCLVQSTHRSDFGHLLQALSCSFVTMGFVLNEAVDMLRSGWRVRAGAAALIGLCIVTLWASVSADHQKQLKRSDWSISLEHLTRFYWASPSVFMQKTEEVYGEQEYISLAKVIKRHTAADERVFAVPFMTSLYVLSERAFAGRQMLVAPGYFSTTDDQRLLVEALQKQGHPVIVEQEAAGFDERPERDARAFAATLFEYVEDHYQRLEDGAIPSGYWVWVRKPSPCSESFAISWGWSDDAFLRSDWSEATAGYDWTYAGMMLTAEWNYLD